jgi:hypothetical protein
MGWAKREDAIAAVKSGYNRALEHIQHLSEAERGIEKIPAAIDAYLKFCRLAGRQEKHDLIESCLERFLLKHRQLSWKI